MANGDISRWWERIAIFLAGLLVATLGAYFQYGASRQDIDRAVEAHKQVSKAEVEGQFALINLRLATVEQKVDRIGVAVGVNARER